MITVRTRRTCHYMYINISESVSVESARDSREIYALMRLSHAPLCFHFLNWRDCAHILQFRNYQLHESRRADISLYVNLLTTLISDQSLLGSRRHLSVLADIKLHRLQTKEISYENSLIVSSFDKLTSSKLILEKKNMYMK